VLIGVSRSGKTPLAMYLAHKGLMVANMPLVPESPVPMELFEVPNNKIIGLMIDPAKLARIRRERLRVWGLIRSLDVCQAGAYRRRAKIC